MDEMEKKLIANEPGNDQEAGAAAEPAAGKPLTAPETPVQAEPAEAAPAYAAEAVATAPAAAPAAPAAPPGRRWGALGAAALVALGAVLGAIGGTAATYRALQDELRRAPAPVGESVQGKPVVFSGEVNVAQIYKKVSPAVVEIRSADGPGSRGGSGTGFIFDGRGYILTNFHVVDTNTNVVVILDDGTRLSGKVLGSDPSNDLAVVAVEPKGRTLPVLPLGDSDAVEPGEPAIAIGFPLGEGKSVTAGIVSGKNRTSDAPSGWMQLGMIQTDAALNPGNSGGPLLNAAGQVIGVNAQAVSRGFGGIGLAVPINTAKRLIPDMIAGSTVQHPWLGISGLPLTAQLAEQHKLSISRGVVVVEIVEGSPAQAGGLKGATVLYNNDMVLGDIITAMDGRPVTSVEELSGYLQTRRPNDRVTLTVLRDGSPAQVEVVLKARPSQNRR